VLTVAKSTSTPNVTNTPTGTVATYSITVSNAASTGTATTVNVSDALPAGFTYAATVSVVLNGGATRPSTVNPALGATNPTFGIFSIPGAGSVVITFTVNIASTVAPGTYNNPATGTYLDPTRLTTTASSSVSYPGGGPDRVSVGMPDMTIGKSHVDPFVRGSTTSTYTLIASNVGGAATVGPVTVTDPLPAGLTPTAAAGTGWTCPAPAGQTVTCTRANALAAGASYPAITVTVTVLASAANSVVNVASVSGGGETNIANNTASDPTNIISLPGLPDTSGPPTEQPAGSSSLLALAALAVMAGVAAMATRRPIRFRQRRRRPNYSAISVLLCLVACTPASGALWSPSAAPTVRAPIVAEAVSELIADTVVTTSKPAPALEDSFHAAAGPITPSRLRIPSIAVDAPVTGVGLLRDGSMAVPDNLWVSAWLSSGPRPGQAGSTVIAGHRGISTPGLFGHLENVRQGDRIRVSDASGGELVYQVTRVASLDLSTSTQLQVFGPTVQQQLVLITCFGQYLKSDRTYDHRLVVFSRLLPPGA
jgi:LPXTG-site transpeptidase (sortase) family protein